MLKTSSNGFTDPVFSPNGKSVAVATEAAGNDMSGIDTLSVGPRDAPLVKVAAEGCYFDQHFAWRSNATLWWDQVDSGLCTENSRPTRIYSATDGTSWSAAREHRGAGDYSPAFG